MSITPTFTRRGTGSIDKKSGSGFGPRTTFFKLKDGEVEILRFLTDFQPAEVDGELRGGWLPVLQHDPLPTRSFEGQPDNWPKHMGAPCRVADIFNGQYPDCYIDEHLVGQPNGFNGKIGAARVKYWSVACLREEVRDEKGNLQGYRDKVNTWTKKNSETGEEEEVSEKALVLINLSDKNFYSKLAGFGAVYGTILDRDYHVKRIGADKDTDYQVTPLDPIEVDGERFDTRNPKFMVGYLPDAKDVGSAVASDNYLFPIIAERSSDDFYNRFFDPRNGNPEVGGSKTARTEAPQSTPVQTPATDASPEDLSGLIGRLQGTGSVAPEPVSAGAGLKNLG